MMQKDYIMREIEGLTRLLANTLFQKDLERESMIDESFTVSGDGYLLYTLYNMISDGKINEAENLLFDEIEREPRREYLEIAAQFYSRLASMGDAALASCNFSREEMLEGLAEIKRIYNVTGNKEARS